MKACPYPDEENGLCKQHWRQWREPEFFQSKDLTGRTGRTDNEDPRGYHFHPWTEKVLAELRLAYMGSTQRHRREALLGLEKKTGIPMLALRERASKMRIAPPKRAPERE